MVADLKEPVSELKVLMLDKVEDRRYSNPAPVDAGVIILLIPVHHRERVKVN